MATVPRAQRLLNAARFEKIANARFSSAGLGKHALRRSLTLECQRERLVNPTATQFPCSEQAAAEVYTALRSGAFYDYGSDPAMSWCLARCLIRSIVNGDIAVTRLTSEIEIIK